MMPAPSLTRPPDALAIGASAGGIQALGTLLPALPARLSLPVFIVLHLPRERPSRLAEILARACALPVREAQDKEPVAPGTVYVAPPDYHLLLDAGPQLALSADTPVHHSRPSIDVLFESAADLYGPLLLALLLTGANRDGAAGLQAVHRAGGMTAVQEPQSALAPLMPASALRLGHVDLVLTLEQMAALLAALPTRTRS